MTGGRLSWRGDPADIVAAEHLAPGEVLARLVDRPPWIADALCRQPQHADVNWFPERGESARPALAVCGSCPVMLLCRAWALANDSNNPVGILGGMSGRARRSARAARRRGPR